MKKKKQFFRFQFGKILCKDIKEIFIHKILFNVKNWILFLGSVLNVNNWKIGPFYVDFVYLSDVIPGVTWDFMDL